MANEEKKNMKAVRSISIGLKFDTRAVAAITNHRKIGLFEIYFFIIIFYECKSIILHYHIGLIVSNQFY